MISTMEVTVMRDDRNGSSQPRVRGVGCRVRIHHTRGHVNKATAKCTHTTISRCSTGPSIGSMSDRSLKENVYSSACTPRIAPPFQHPLVQ